VFIFILCVVIIYLQFCNWNLHSRAGTVRNENLIVIIILLFADDLKIFCTVQLQLTLYFHNPVWIPSPVGVLLTSC